MSEERIDEAIVDLVDTHCHLNHALFQQDLVPTIERAVAAGVRRMVVVGYDLASSEAAVSLAEQRPELYASVGMHPHDSAAYDSKVEERLRILAARPRVVAIGEIGLDYHYDYPLHAQRRAFIAQLDLAREAGLPVIIHCREAYTDTLDILEDAGIAHIGGVMHCWMAGPAEAERAVALGMYLGFGGGITFKKATEVRESAAMIPADRLLVETDAPYMTPIPPPARRNEPAFTRIVAETLAAVREVSLPEIARITTANAERLFARLRVQSP